MSNLLFSPSGRIGPQTFLKGLGIVALINAVIKSITAFNFSLGSVLALVGLVLLFPLFCLLIKRSHDGGKTGWLSIAWFILILILIMIAQYIAQKMTGGAVLKEMEAVTQAAAASGDIGAVLSIATEYAPKIAQKTAIPAAIAGFVGTMLGGYLVNMLVKSDPNENKFGPAV